MAERRTRSLWDIRVGERLVMSGTDGGELALELVEKSGRRARIMVLAPSSVSIMVREGADTARAMRDVMSA